MKKLISLSLVLIMVAALLAGCGSDKKAGGELVIYTWEGMFDKQVIADFEKETGIEVKFSNFDTNETMLAKLEENKGSDYDLVVADDYIIEMVIKEGLAQKLDKDKISTLKNINPIYQGHFYDKNNEYTVPYGAGMPLLVYDKKATGFDLKSYQDLWDKSLKNNVALIGNYRVINGITLNTMGKSLNEENLADIKKAGEKMIQLADNVRVINDNNTQDFLINGEVKAALLYTSQVNLALDANPDLKVGYPSEGLGFGIMNGFIPKNAPNSDAAHKFLEYINQPKVAAKCFESLGYYTTNKASEEYISKEKYDRIVLPKEYTKGEIIHNISKEADAQEQKNWNLFKKATK
ncbi:MAG: spermidine/putrescine ABC transporter substrate-binding protein [Anaerovoracaceae bacterium]